MNLDFSTDCSPKLEPLTVSLGAYKAQALALQYTPSSLLLHCISKPWLRLQLFVWIITPRACTQRGNVIGSVCPYIICLCHKLTKAHTKWMNPRLKCCFKYLTVLRDSDAPASDVDSMASLSMVPNHLQV